MAGHSLREITSSAHQAGYNVIASEQLRPNRWLVTLEDGLGATILVMVQVRPLVGAADVQDLAELVRLRRASSGILLAPGGAFSTAAQHTSAELSAQRLRLCTTLPPAARSGAEDAIPASASLNVAS